MTENEAALIIQKAYRKTNKLKENSDMLVPLEEMDRRFIKPFATKWKKSSIFHVLMRYRAIKLQDFFNFCQQVHLYNLNTFHITHQYLGSIDLKYVNEKARVSSWLGEHSKAVLKLRFRLDDMPFYDTSCMRDLYTNLGNIEDEWDSPYLWREDQSKENCKSGELKVNFEGPRGLVNIQYTRDPDEPIVCLPSPFEEIEECMEGRSEDYSIKTNVNALQNTSYQRGNCSNQNINRNNQYSKHKGSSTTKRSVTYNFDDSNRNKAEKESYNIYTKPANKDFDYIKAAPIPAKPKHYADPVAELRTIAHTSSNASEDDPPFNFQGMLRKTNFRRDSMKNITETVRRDSLKNAADERRDSLKNAMQAVRRFSLTKGNEYSTVVNSGSYGDKGLSSKQISVEILPGVFINGLEAEL